ncbi:MAG: 6-phosphogluconolactonase [Actinobacteria bacterium]|nr:6-phosphogluconolactonase [Actinomycetota bacterium]
MKIICNTNRDVLDIAASDFFTDQTKKILNTKDSVTWALPGGRSVSGIFRSLSIRNDIPWVKIHFFIVDERMVPLSDIESNYRLLEENLTGDLIKKGYISRENIHPFIYKPGKDDNGSGDYEEELKKFGGYFDIVLLSSGEDGHVAGIYPSHHSIKNNYKYFFTMDDSPKPPCKRMSSSRILLLKSRSAVLLFYGDSKKSAFKRFMDRSITRIECPAKIVSKINNSLVLTDQE